MTTTIILAVLVVLGALVYALASNAKAAELGRILYGVAILALLLGLVLGHPILR